MDDLGINIKDAEKVLKVFSDAVPDNNGSGYSKKAITAFCGHVTTILKAAASFSNLEESSPSKILDHVLQTLLAHPNTMQQAERTKPQERLALPTIVKIMEGCDEQIQKWAATADEALPSTSRVPIQINTVLLEQVVSDLASAKVKERIMRIAHELSLTQEEFATFETFIQNAERGVLPPASTPTTELLKLRGTLAKFVIIHDIANDPLFSYISSLEYKKEFDVFAHHLRKPFRSIRMRTEGIQVSHNFMGEAIDPAAVVPTWNTTSASPQGIARQASLRATTVPCTTQSPSNALLSDALLAQLTAALAASASMASASPSPSPASPTWAGKRASTSDPTPVRSAGETRMLAEKGLCPRCARAHTHTVCDRAPVVNLAKYLNLSPAEILKFGM